MSTRAASPRARPAKRGRPPSSSAACDPKAIILGAERYRDDPPRMSRPIDYTAHPATWLNGECWLEQQPGAQPERHQRPGSRTQPRRGTTDGRPGRRAARNPPAQARGRRKTARRLLDGPLPGPRRPQASLTIAAAPTQPVVLNCNAGCEPADILAKLGLDLGRPVQAAGRRSRPRGEWTPARRGRRGLRLRRRGRRPAVPGAPHRRASSSRSASPTRTRKTGWRWSLGDTRRVLYRLPKIIEAVTGRRDHLRLRGRERRPRARARRRHRHVQPGRGREVARASTPSSSATPSSSSSRTRTSPARRTPGRSRPASRASPPPSRSPRPPAREPEGRSRTSPTTSPPVTRSPTSWSPGPRTRRPQARPRPGPARVPRRRGPAVRLGDRKASSSAATG